MYKQMLSLTVFQKYIKMQKNHAIFFILVYYIYILRPVRNSLPRHYLAGLFPDVTVTGCLTLTV